MSTIRHAQGYAPGFDLSVERGTEGENTVAEMLLFKDTDFEVVHVEVKCDDRALGTAHVFIEYECLGRDGRWRPSGISLTEALVWFFVINNEERLTISVSTDEVRRQFERFRASKHIQCDHCDPPSRGVLIPVVALVTRPAGVS